MGKVKVSNGTDTYEIDSNDLNAAVKEGYKPTERIIVANSKTKESYEIDPKDVAHALNDGFTYSDIARKQQSSPQTSPQPSFQVTLSEPTFKSAPAQVAPRQFDYNAEPPKTTLSKLKGKAIQSVEKLTKEIDENKSALGKVVVNDRLREQEKRKQAGVYGPQLEDKLFITDEDLNKINTEAKVDRNRANEVLTAAMNESPEKQKEISKNLYAVDAFNSAANDPNGEERANKIAENIKGIERGELFYDHNRKIVVNPQGFFGSLVSGRNELNRLSDAYDATKKMEDNGNEAGIIMGLNDWMKNNDPDKPVNVPSGILGEIGQGIGGMPIKGMAAGAVASAGTALLGNPEASANAFHLASAAVNANDMYKIGYQNALEQNYAKFKKENPDMLDYDAFKKAQDLAGKQAVTDAASAAAMQYFGGKVGFGAAKQLSKGISAGLTQLGDNLGKKAFEAAGIGGIGAGTQAIKNIMAQQAGLKVDTKEGVGQAFDSGILITGAMSMLGLANEYLKPSTKEKLISGLGKAPENVVDEGLNRLQQTGTLTPEQSENVKSIIKEQRLLEEAIPPELPETDRLKIGAKIKERSILKQKLERVDEAFHPEIDEQIKNLNKDILDIQKGADRGELQSLVNKEIKKDNVQGVVVDVLRHASEKELEGFMKDIAEQAAEPATTQATIDTFGEEIVNKAKELHPDVKVPMPVIEEQGKLINIEKNRTEELSAPSEIKIGYQKVKEGNLVADINLPETNGESKIATLYDRNKKIDSFELSSEEFEKLKNTTNRDDRLSLKKEIANRRINELENSKSPENITENATPIRSNEGQISTAGNEPGSSAEQSGSDIQQPSQPTSINGEVEQQAGGGTEADKGKSEEKVAELKVDEAYGLPFIEEPNDKRTGIKNAISKMTRFERKLLEVELPPLLKDADKFKLGKELVDSGKINPIDVVNRVLNAPIGEHGVQPNEALALQYYAHQLDRHSTNLREQLATTNDPVEHAAINAQIQQFSDEIDALTEANIKSGNAWSDVGDTRQIVADIGFNPHRDLATIKEAYGGEIPKDVKARLDKVMKERDDALNKLAKLQADEKAKSVEETIKKEGAEKNTKKTKEDFKSERNDIKKSIADKLKKGRTGESGLTAVPLPFAKELIEISPEIFKLIKSYAEEGVQKTEEVINRLHEALKDELDGIQKVDIVNLLAGRYKAQGEDVSPIAQRIRDFRSEANLWTKIAEATKMQEDTPVKKEEKNKKLKDLKDRLNEIRERNKESVKSIQDILTSDSAKELKKLEQRRKAAESQLKNKKYLLPQSKTNAPLTNEIVKEKQKIVNANYKIKTEKRRAFESQKNLYQKGLMWLARMTRLSILSGYNVLGKLAAAATIGGAGKRIPEQAIGYIYGQIFRGIAEKAPIEGMTSAAAEAKFYKEFFNPKTFAKNAWQILKTGESPLSQKFSQGQYEHIPLLYLPTDLHQIIKDPVKRATYEASFKNGLAWAERNGLDINDDLVVQSIQNAAYKRAQYEIFQESNAISRKFGELRANLEKKGNTGATIKALVDFMIPVSTVPTNIARRLVTTSPAGLIRGSAKVIEAYRNGIEKLKPEEADAVMKQLKQGTLGTALWMVGWFGYQSFGGLYSKFNPNKERDQGDLSSDEMSVDGKMVPKPVQHALPLEIIQFAATARRVYDNYKENKGVSTPEAIEKAGLASIGALTEQIPVIETAAHAIGAFNNPYEAKKLEEDVKRRFEPQILKETGIIGKDKEGGGGGAGASGHFKPSKTTKYTKSKKH